MSVFQEDYYTHYICQAITPENEELTVYFGFGSDTATSVNKAGLRQNHSITAGCVSPENFPIFGFKIKGLLHRCRLQDFDEMKYWGN